MSRYYVTKYISCATVLALSVQCLPSVETRYLNVPNEKEVSTPKYDEKEVSTPNQEEQPTDSVTIVEGQHDAPKSTKKKEKSKSKPATSKIQWNNLVHFHTKMKEALAKNSDKTLNIVNTAFGVANA
jgi:hypothetical protein